MELPDHPDERPFLSYRLKSFFPPPSSKTSPFRLPGKQTLDHQGPPSFKIAQFKKKNLLFYLTTIWPFKDTLYQDNAVNT